MYVIGTAGHVDHGKSTLVKALTSIDPDRLPEEKEREMTVDLGFAWMTLPSGREVSIVDVPGHERFIKNMLAGVGGIDLALLIVAADESVMPQTREHLAILDILRVTRGLVVVTKTDLVDEELVELVKAEVEDTLQGTSFEGCPMVGVSAYTGDGLDDLRGMIDRILDDTEMRRDLGRPRLPIDRCFSISGFGTVVTGTLIDGSLAVGQEIELAGSQQRARIRGLQSHKTKVSSAEPGVRLAVNLSGISRDDIDRGEILTSPGWLRPARRLDARLRMVSDTPHPLRHNEGVTFHLFTSESPARVRLLDAEQLEAGSEGWVQLLLEEPLAMVKGDYFVVRSSENTLGGGQVVDPNPRRRHRRFDLDVSERLMLLDEGADEDVIVSVAEQWGPCGLTELSRRANLPREEALQRAAELAEEGDLVALGDLVSDATRWCIRRLDGEPSRAAWPAFCAPITTSIPCEGERPRRKCAAGWACRSRCTCGPWNVSARKVSSPRTDRRCGCLDTRWSSRRRWSSRSPVTCSRWSVSRTRRLPTSLPSRSCWGRWSNRGKWSGSGTAWCLRRRRTAK